MSVMVLSTEHQKQTLSWTISRKCAYVHMQVNAVYFLLSYMSLAACPSGPYCTQMTLSSLRREQIQALLAAATASKPCKNGPWVMHCR